MADLLTALQGGFSNPLMGLAAGLLHGGSPGQTLGSGMMQGINLMQQMQQNQFRQDFATRQLSQRIEEQRYKRMAQDRAYQEGVRQFDVTQDWREQEAERKALQPLSTPGKVEADYQAGRISREQRDEALRKQALVQIGGEPAQRAPLITGQDAVALGFNADDVIQQDPKTGKLNVVASGKEERQARTAVSSMSQAVGDYRETLDQYGPTVMPSPERLQLSAKHTDLLMKAKDYYELGALTGPDMEMIDKILVDPTSPQAQLYGKDALIQQLDVIDQMLNSAEQRDRKSVV